MIDNKYYQEIHDICCILADSHFWPNPATVYVIPDEKGFSLFDVGCGGQNGLDFLLKGLAHWNLDIQDLHTVILSHAHPDHMGAMGDLLKKVQPTVMIHHLDVGSALNPSKLNDSFDIPLAKKQIATIPGSNPHDDFDILDFFVDSGCTMSIAENLIKLDEGDILSLGDFEFEVLHTPGHSPGHISLFDPYKRIMLSGDLVGVAPAWYTPSSGGVIGYLASLDKMEEVNAKIMLPSHGPIINNPQDAIQTIREKLLKRENILLKALEQGPKTFWELNTSLFRESYLHFFPGCGNTQAHLNKLHQEGRLIFENDLYKGIQHFE